MQEERCVGAGGIIYTFLSRHVAAALPLFRGCRQLVPVFPSIPFSPQPGCRLKQGGWTGKLGNLRSFLMLHPKHSGVRADLLLPIAHTATTEQHPQGVQSRQHRLASAEGVIPSHGDVKKCPTKGKFKSQVQVTFWILKSFQNRRQESDANTHLR